MEKTIYWFNQIHPAAILFLIALANYAGFRLYGGEEQYFAFARQFMDPDWIPGSHSLTHPAGGNLLFNMIAGSILKFISFEQLAFWGRLVNFLLLSIPLGLIFRKFKVSNIAMAFVFQLFFLPHQSLFAHEWIFQNFEVKSLAYIFVFWSLYYLFDNKPYRAVIFAALATYFHFIVGGWCMFILGVWFIFGKTSIRRLILLCLSYLLILSPFLVYLASVYMKGNPTVINGVNINWIYAYERLPHHLGIFKSWEFFASQHLDGVLISLVLFLACIFYFRRFKNPNIKSLNRFNIILFSQQFFFVLVAVFDRQGSILKLYPFRTNSLSVLFILIELALIFNYYTIPWVQHQLNSVSKRQHFLKNTAVNLYLNSLALVLTLFFVGLEVSQSLANKNSDIPIPSADMKELMNYVGAKSGNEMYMILHHDYPLSFQRITGKDRFVVEKFTPTKSQIVFEWYMRMKWKEMLDKDLSALDSFNRQYIVDYLIADRKLDHPSLQLEKKFGKYYLYQNNKGMQR